MQERQKTKRSPKERKTEQKDHLLLTELKFNKFKRGKAEYNQKKQCESCLLNRKCINTIFQLIVNI